MKAGKIMERAILLILLVAMLSSFVAAVGVSPGRTTIDFNSGAKQSLSFDIINDLHRDTKLMLKVEGLEDGTKLSIQDQVIELKADEERKKISYEVTMPEQYSSPGVKEVRIMLVEIPEDKGQKPMQINAVVGVITQLRIKVPYEGKYVKLEELEITEAGQNETAVFILPVENLGQEDIKGMKATIKIYDPEGKLAGTAVTQEEALGAKKRLLLKAVWAAHVSQGQYKAVAEVDYGTGLKTTEKMFNVGTIGLEILRVYTKKYSLGDIAKMDIVMRSNWNDILKNVYAEMFIKDKVGDPVGELKTATRDYLPGEEAAISAFWDTNGLKEGTYSATLRVYTGLGSSIEKQFQITLALTQLTTSLMGTTGEAIIGEGGSNKGTIIMVVTVILFIVNLVWFIFFRKRRAK